MAGKLWHTIRHTDAFNWDSFGDVTDTQAGDPGFASSISTAELNGELHLVALTNKPWHTIRFANAWQPFGDVLGATNSPNLQLHSIASAGVAGDLHLVGAAWANIEASESRLWHTIRHTQAFNWDSFGDVNATEAGNPSDLSRYGNISATAVGGELHVVAVGSNGRLWHTIRFANSWQPFGDVVAAVGNNPGDFIDVACAAVGDDLHVVGLTKDGGLWHTIRYTQELRWDPFGDIGGTQAGRPGNFWNVSCSGVGTELHVVGIVAGVGIWHTIRSPDGWQPFGDVLGVTGGVPVARFSDIGCSVVQSDLHVAVSVAAPHI